MRKYIAFCALMFVVAFAVFYSGFTLPKPVNVCLLLGAVVADSLTTWLCFWEKGREGNPLVAFLFKKMGFWGTLVLWYALFGLNIWFIYVPSNLHNQTGVWCAYWLVPLNNLFVFWKSRRRNKNAAMQVQAS